MLDPTKRLKLHVVHSKSYFFFGEKYSQISTREKWLFNWGDCLALMSGNSQVSC